VAGVVIVVALQLLGGADPLDILSRIDPADLQPTTVSETRDFEGQDSYEVFASTVLGSNNDLWQNVFVQNRQSYQPPKLVLFRGATESACGGATSDVGPHYCPLDSTIYLDETFFDELTARFGAEGGDVAEAYVIAHEVGHHIQNLRGTIDDARDNESSIKTELQADCFAGLWAHSIRDKNVFEPGEITEALDAAAAVGDDRIQKAVTGRVHPESWTHGSSAERVRWFTRGFETGSVAQCDTFAK
jgi:predicted metalloprotease